MRRRTCAQDAIDSIIDAYLNLSEREAIYRKVVGAYSLSKVEALLRSDIRRKYMEGMQGARGHPVMSQATLDETVECVLDMFPDALPQPPPPPPPPSRGAKEEAKEEGADDAAALRQPLDEAQYKTPPSRGAKEEGADDAAALRLQLDEAEQKARTLEAMLRESERGKACLMVQMNVMQQEQRR